MQTRTACLTARLTCARRSFTGLHPTRIFHLSAQQPQLYPRGRPPRYFSLAEPEVPTWMNRGLSGSNTYPRNRLGSPVQKVINLK
jgi:hypothetical protein